MSKRSTGNIAFMVSCTPLKKKRSDFNEEDSNDEGKTVLILAPFQPQPKLSFNNIRVGVTASREIVVENPLQKNIEIELEFLENEKLSNNEIGKWTLNQTRLKLPAGGSQTLNITWCPTKAGDYHVNVCVKQLLGRNNQSTRKISQISISATSFDLKQIKETKRTVKPLQDRNVVTTTKKSSTVVTKQNYLKTPQRMDSSNENVTRTYTKNRSNVTFDASESTQTSKNLFPSCDNNSLHIESEMISIKIEKTIDQHIMLCETHVLANDTDMLYDTHILDIDSNVLQSTLTNSESSVITDQVIKTVPCDWENDSLDDSSLSNSFKLSSFSSFEKQLNDFNFRSTLDGTVNCIPMPPPPLINQDDTCHSIQNCFNFRTNLSPSINTEKTRNDTYTVSDQGSHVNNQFITSEIKKSISSVPSCDDRAGFNHSISITHVKEKDNSAFQEYNFATDLISQNSIKIKAEKLSLLNEKYCTNEVKSPQTEIYSTSSKVNIQAELPQRSCELWRISPPKRMKIVNSADEESPEILPQHVLKNQKKRPTFKTAKAPKGRLSLKRSPRSGKEFIRNKRSPNIKKYNLPDQLLSSEAASTISVGDEFVSSSGAYQLNDNYSKNPFSESFIAFIDARFVDETEKQLLKWVNIMLSPPLELEAVSLMPTERQILNFSKACIGTSTAHTVQLAKQHKLEFVRKAGRALLMSSDVATVLKKVDVAIENGLIAIRQDRNLHQDIGLQEIVLKLLLCYHPLWLRIALETIYDQSISLNSNSDIGGIVNFIRKHVLSDNYLRKKYAHPTVPFLMRPDFENRMKKFILKKFLTIIFFLDVAKRKKLIRHDPCLFCVNSPFKLTTAILLEFNKEFIKGGDNSKYLSTFGFKLLHKQTCLEEIDLKLRNRNDLRDGIRLTRLVEIIINCEKGKFYNQLKAPALSRFQKIHNIKVALKAYREAGFVIENNVTEVDIANGHREKILSFLWQLRGMTFNAAAFNIQMFWRKHKNMIKERKNFLKTKEAVSKVQKWYRSILAKKNHFGNSEQETYKMNLVIVLKQRKEAAALAKKERTQFLTLKSATISVQRKWRALVAMRKCRMQFLKYKKAVKLIESHRKAVILARQHKTNYLLLKSVVIYIQRKWKAILAMRKCRMEYLQLKLSVSFVESQRKALIVARKQRAHFLALKDATINVQRRWRAILFMRKIRMSLANKKYLLQLKSAVSFVEMKRKAVLMQRNHPLLSSNERADFLSLKMSVIIIQRKWRALLAMRKCRTEYLQIKFAVAKIESLRKAANLAKKEREVFLAVKSAAIIIQRKWRATLAMHECRRFYMKLKWTVSYIETKRRSLICARKERTEFIILKNTTIKIQRRWKAILHMRKIRNTFLKVKWAVRYVEAKRSAIIASRRDQIEFIALRGATTAIQKRWRALLEMRKCRAHYLQLKKAVSLIESKRICTVNARKAQSYFIAIKSATITLQRKWRAILLMKQCRRQYLKLKDTVYLIESKRIAVITSRKVQIEFQLLKNAAIIIQKKWRAILAMRECRRAFLRLKWAISLVKSKRLAIITAREDRVTFLRLKVASINIQRKWRAIIAMRNERTKYLRLKWAVTVLKSRRVATITATKERAKFIAFKQAVIIIQRQWRKKLFMRKIRISLKQKYYMMRIKPAVRFVEMKRKSTIIARKERAKFLALRAAAITVQRKWRAELFKRNLKIKLTEQRQINERRNEAAIKIQRFFKEQLIRRRFEMERLNSAATKIQAFWRGCNLRRKSTIVFRKNFKPLAPGKTLSEMKIGLIDKLRKTNTIQKIVHCLQMLDSITTFSPHLSHDLVQEGVIEIIYTLLASLNRNVSDQQARVHAYMILVNLTKIGITSEIVWMVTSKLNGCDIILSDCLNYCKLNESIFCACATLLWLWSFHPRKVQVIINHPKYKFVAAKINKELSGVVKGKCSSNSGKTLPSRVPNWGMDKKKSGLKLFLDSRFAWKVLSESLSIL